MCSLGSTLLCTVVDATAKDVLENKDELMKVLKEVLKEKKVDVREEIGHQFEKSGASVVYILGSSHLAVHTWPEKKSMTVDLHMCSTDSINDTLILCNAISLAIGGKITTQNLIQH